MPSPDAAPPVEVLIDADRIAGRVRELGATIAGDYAGRPLLVVGVLTGAAFFTADLVRCMALPVELDFIRASSYGAGTESSGIIRMSMDLSQQVADRHILLVEDIADTGLTLSTMMEALRARSPLSVEACVLLNKPARRMHAVDIRYTGFDIDDRFVVGYGLDHAGEYRNLPYIGVVRH